MFMIIEVLICADMAYKRKALSTYISSNPGMVVVNIARNGIDAMKMVEKYLPNILIIDIKSENFDFLHDFRNLNEKISLPTIFVLDPDDDVNLVGKKVVNLHFKEFYYVKKPEGRYDEQFQKIIGPLTDKILKITQRRFQKIEKKKGKLLKTLRLKEESFYYKRSPLKYAIKQEPSLNDEVDAIEIIKYDTPDLASIDSIKLGTNIIVMGASVGGPNTFRNILKEIPSTFPSPILLVQHMDHFFMRQFAVSLKRDCNLLVKIPRNGEYVESNTIYVSPGGNHMELIVMNNKPAIRIFEGEPVNYCRPSVDVLFYSAAKVYKNHTLGILLTGMGKDGVEGLLEIKKMGGMTIAESEETSVLYGMPKIAAERNAAHLIIPNYQIKDYMIKFAKRFKE